MRRLEWLAALALGSGFILGLAFTAAPEPTMAAVRWATNRSVFTDPLDQTAAESRRAGILPGRGLVDGQLNGQTFLLRFDEVRRPLADLLNDHQRRTREAALLAFRSLTASAEGQAREPDSEEDWLIAIALTGSVLHEGEKGALICYFVDEENFPGSTLIGAEVPTLDLAWWQERAARTAAGEALFRPGRPVAEFLVDRGPSTTRIVFSAPGLSLEAIAAEPDGYTDRLMRELTGARETPVQAVFRFTNGSSAIIGLARGGGLSPAEVLSNARTAGFQPLGSEKNIPEDGFILDARTSAGETLVLKEITRLDSHATPPEFDWLYLVQLPTQSPAIPPTEGRTR